MSFQKIGSIDGTIEKACDIALVSGGDLRRFFSILDDMGLTDDGWVIGEGNLIIHAIESMEGLEMCATDEANSSAEKLPAEFRLNRERNK